MARLNLSILVMALGLVGFLVPFEVVAQGKSEITKVRCDHGETITKALQISNLNKPLVIQITGDCHENVSIHRSDTTLSGTDPDSSKIIGIPETDPIKESPITISGARNVIVENLTVTNGGSSGIVVVNGRASILDSVVSANAQDGGGSGIFVGTGGHATIDNVIVEDNPFNGIQIARGGSTAITNSLIQLNGASGIRLDEGGSARIGVDLLNDPGGNTISDNTGGGISLNRSSTARIENNTVEDNESNGIGIYQGSSAQITGNTVLGNRYEIVITDGSTAQLTGNTVTDDSSDHPDNTVPLGVYRSSNARLLGGNTLLQQNTSSSAVALEAFHVVQVRQSGSDSDVLTGPQAVSMGNFATVDLRGSDYTLNGDVGVFEFGTFRVRGTGTIDGDINANSLFTTARERSGSTISLTGSCNGDNCTIAPD